jgi:hypothetical protein
VVTRSDWQDDLRRDIFFMADSLLGGRGTASAADASFNSRRRNHLAGASSGKGTRR